MCSRHTSARPLESKGEELRRKLIKLFSQTYQNRDLQGQQLIYVEDFEDYLVNDIFNDVKRENDLLNAIFFPVFYLNSAYDYIETYLNHIPSNIVARFFSEPLDRSYSPDLYEYLDFMKRLLEDPELLKIFLNHGLDPNNVIQKSSSFIPYSGGANVLLFPYHSSSTFYPLVFEVMNSIKPSTIDSLRVLLDDPRFDLFIKDAEGNTVFNYIKKPPGIRGINNEPEDAEITRVYNEKFTLLVKALAQKIKNDMFDRLIILNRLRPSHKEADFRKALVLYTYYSDLCLDIQRKEIPPYYILGVAELLGIPWLTIIRDNYQMIHQRAANTNITVPENWYQTLCNLIRQKRLQFLNKGQTTEQAFEPLQKRHKN